MTDISKYSEQLQEALVLLSDDDIAKYTGLVDAIQSAKDLADKLTKDREIDPSKLRERFTI